MKRILSIVLIFCFLFASSSSAAPSLIPVKELKLLADIGNIEEINGVVTSGNAIVIYGTKFGKSYARAINNLGEELWKVDLDPQSQSLATAATADTSGNIWISGSISADIPGPASTPSLTPLNPDNVISMPQDVDSSLRNIVLWQIDQNTHAISKYLLPQALPVLITSMALDKNGVSISGIASTSNGNSGFVLSANLHGEFGTLLTFGNKSTTLDSIIRNSDGSLTAVGSSSETLGGKKLIGLTDGVIIKIAKNGSILSVVRSSAAKASRNWKSASSSFLLGGEVLTGNKTESAVTKFSSTYDPTWTHRFASTGLTFTSGATYAFFASTGQISEIAKWAPKSARPLLLAFDAKGRIVGGYSAPTNQREVIGLASSKVFGLLCVSASKDLVSIFSIN